MNVDLDRQQWDALVQKTRRRPLVYGPALHEIAGVTELRMSLKDRLGSIAVFGINGLVFAGAALFLDAGSMHVGWRILIAVVGFGALLAAITRAIYFVTLRMDPNSEQTVLRFGLFCCMKSITLLRNDLIAEYGSGDQTDLPRGMESFKHVMIRHAKHPGRVHLGYGITTEQVLPVYEGLCGLLGDSRNYSEAVVTTASGTKLVVPKSATWEAGKWRTYQSTISSQSDQIQIQRRSYGENRNVVEEGSDIYPVRLEQTHNDFRIVYSNQTDRRLDRYECLAIQVCCEPIAQRDTRYEINLIVDSFKQNRVHLITFDISGLKSPQTVHDTAAQTAAFFDLPVLDHT